jgi:hypothetical protein
MLLLLSYMHDHIHLNPTLILLSPHLIVYVYRQVNKCPSLHCMLFEWPISSPLWHSWHSDCQWWAPGHRCCSDQTSVTGRPRSERGEGDQIDCQTGGQRSGRFCSAVEHCGSARLIHSPAVCIFRVEYLLDQTCIHKEKVHVQFH